ncbi:alpha/beta hydrolase [Sphingomonas montanisoli]|uniref:Alpha/beta hydrolase n=1 Tax=Sphingomonas montanisoli TaxID=2606412 RepID=A0A5D9C9E1_9SPHN|nr:alpha/beta hydrolase [Sphingomonas montanisoli]TZG27887.1 alpha/beta hydrolase [Sphingomonas montanisoli]
MAKCQALIFDSGPDVAEALGAPATIRGDLFLPEGAPRLLMVCIAGGGMNRHYFDLPTPPGEEEASFVRAMMAKGFAVALLDFLGIGDSDEPADPFRLTPDLHAQALAAATRALQAQTGLRTVGVGHSFGAGLNVAIQAHDALHLGLALLGFGVAPLARLTMPAEADLPIEEARARFAEFAENRFKTPYLTIEPMGGPRGAMLTTANDRLLATSAYATVLPHTFKPEADLIDVPLLIGLGDKDLHGEPREAIRHFPKSRDITLIELPETRHNHFVYPSRTHLFDRIAHWASGL